MAHGGAEPGAPTQLRVRVDDVRATQASDTSGCGDEEAGQGLPARRHRRRDHESPDRVVGPAPCLAVEGALAQSAGGHGRRGRRGTRDVGHGGAPGSQGHEDPQRRHVPEAQTPTGEDPVGKGVAVKGKDRGGGRQGRPSPQPSCWRGGQTKGCDVSRVC